MANDTTISPTTETKDIPYWMILIWCIAGFLVVTLVIVAIYYSYVVCCQKKKRRQQSRSYTNHNNIRNPTENYPRAFIEQLHNGDINSRSMFSPSFVDHMRIPRAMEVKMVESVNSLNKLHPPPSYSPPSLTPISENDLNDYLNADMFSLPAAERMPPSRQQSFRYQNMSTEESKERIYREKMLVSELRQKLRNQRKIDE